MSNCCNSTTASIPHETNLFVTYYPFMLVVTGTIFNLFTFIILCRPVFRNTHKRPTIHYMRTTAIFDTLMLYGWNFDHHLSYAYGFTLFRYSIVSCKIVSFLNYFAPQVSAWVRVFICLDRYLSLSRLHKTWFGQSKSVLIIIASIVSIFFLLNFHFFVFVCYNKADGSVEPNSHLYRVYPLWDHLNLVLYNGVPFVLMGMFNSGVIYHLIRLRRTTMVQNSRIRHRSISVTLVITTCLFLLMTTPATISFGFLQEILARVILQIFDYIMYTYHIFSFPLYFATFREFRHEALGMVSRKKLAYISLRISTSQTTAV